jgi:large subunit ribosomal protein L21
MYAVVSSGGKQYRVEPGSTLLMERLASQPGGSILFDRVLLIGDGDEVTVGTPVVAGASVSGTVLGEELGPKLVIFKFKQKVKYRRRTGHRQHLLRVRIDEINAEGRPKARAKAKPEADVTPVAEKAAATPTATPTAKPTKPAAKPRASRARAVKAADPTEATEKAASVQPEAEASGEKPKPRRRSPRPKAEKAQE